MSVRNLLILLGIVFITSCEQKQDITIGFLLPTYEVARYSIDRDNFVARASELGAKVIVENAENDDKLQIKQATALIDQGVDVLVIISVNQNTAPAIVREAKDKKVKVVAYERLIQNCELDYFIAFDNYMVGKDMATAALKKCPEGNYVIISGDKTDKNAELINTGNKDAINSAVQSGKVKLIYNTFIEDWAPESAYMIMKQVLNTSGDDVNVVLAANDGMAGGIIKALQESGLAGKVIVTGNDAELPACQRIYAGTQAITVYKSLKTQAKFAAEVAVSLAKNEKPAVETITTFNGKIDVPTVSIKPTVVDMDNIRQTIIADGFHTEKAILGN